MRPSWSDDFDEKNKTMGQKMAKDKNEQAHEESTCATGHTQETVLGRHWADVLCSIASALCRFRCVLFTSQNLRDMLFTPDDLQLALSAGLQKDSLLDDIFKVAFCVAVPHVIVDEGCWRY